MLVIDIVCLFIWYCGFCYVVCVRWWVVIWCLCFLCVIVVVVCDFYVYCYFYVVFFLGSVCYWFVCVVVGVWLCFYWFDFVC